MDKATDEGKEVQRFISNHDATRAMSSKFSKLKLVRPADTRFASNFMMLRRLVRVKSPLKQLVTSGEWDQWKKQNDQADTIEKRLLSSDLWDKVEKYVKVLWLVMAMLRVVDKDEPIMGVMYEAIDQMLEQIKEILKENKDGALMYEEIHELAQEHWDMLPSPLHATAFLLNPILFSKKPYENKEVMKGVTIKDASMEDIEGIVKKLPLIFVRGSNIRFVHIPDSLNVSDAVEEMRLLQDKVALGYTGEKGGPSTKSGQPSTAGSGEL
ncbi:hypothetical protein L7F22_042836 [Adiantum nelumboides]|nr:hypothetical protein [Adiantum nelumboides]